MPRADLPSLFPEVRPEPDTCTSMLALVQIAVPEGSEQPDADLIQSVRRLGVLQPVALRFEGGQGGRYSVIDGRRRVLAARAAGLTHIPASIYNERTGPSLVAGMTLTTNMVRRPNLMAELEAIERLMEEGYTEAAISTQLRLNRATVRKRLLLARLIPNLRIAVAHGHMRPAVAALAARLPASNQETLVSLLDTRRSAAGLRESQRRITAHDVRVLSHARRTDAVRALGPEVFDTPGYRPVPAAPIQRGPTPDARDTPLEPDEADAFVWTVFGRTVRVSFTRSIMTPRLMLSVDGEQWSPSQEADVLRNRIAEIQAQMQTNVAGMHRELERARRELTDLRANRGLVPLAPGPETAPETQVPPTIGAGDGPDQSVAVAARMGVNREDHTWENVDRMLNVVEECLPASPDHETEALAHGLETYREAVRRMFGRTTVFETTDEGAVAIEILPPVVANAPPRSARELGRRVRERRERELQSLTVRVRELTIRGQPMFALDEGTNRYYMRYQDNIGRLRRRFFRQPADYVRAAREALARHDAALTRRA